MTDRPGLPTSLPAPRGVPWADGRVTLRVREPGPGPGRIVRWRRPFAVVGRHPRADLRIDDRAVAPRHAFLLLDRRGLLCVDLLSRTGTRRAGRDVASAWLGVGETLEIAGRRLELLRFDGDGGTIDPNPGDDDPFAPAGGELPRLELAPVDDPGRPPWIIGSPLAFLGRSPACALRVAGSAVAPIHCAIWREPMSTRVIDLLGRTTEVDGRAVEGSAPLRDGDVLRVGRARFSVSIEGASNHPAAIAPSTAEAAAEVPAGPDLADIMGFLRQFQGDAATLIEGQFGQIDALRRELAALRDEVRRDQAPAVATHLPFQIEVTSPLSRLDSDDNAAWLLDRINALEPEVRSNWRGLLGRIAASIATRSTSAIVGSPATGKGDPS